MATTLVQDGLTRKFLLFSALVLLSIASVYFSQVDDANDKNSSWHFFYPAEDRVKVEVHHDDGGSELIHEGRCGPPQIPMWHPTALKYHSRVSVNCAMNTTKFTAPLFSIHHGSWLQRHVDLDVLGLSCLYRPFFPKDEMTNTFSTTFTKITLPRTEIPSKIDFIEVVCRDKNKSISYRDAFSLVDMNKADTIMPPSSSPSRSPRLNVVIIGLDATSRLNFKRLMPQASAFLLDELGAVDLEEYSVVGTGTAKNEIPMLTGLSYGEVKKECKKRSVRKCRSLFLFQDFANMGYITSLSEDYSTWTLQSPIKNAFMKNNPMLTYYNRPLEVYTAQQQTLRNSSLYCFGPRVTLQPLLNFVESVSQVGRDLKKRHFQLVWSGRITHDAHNALALGEPSLLDFLHTFKNSSSWNDTLLLVMADHGQGLEMDFWDTPEGRQEYNLPLAYVVLPPWFQIRYPKKFANLKENARQKVVTPYDIHETLQEILHLNDDTMKRNKSKRGTSLFDKIPRRKCIEAGISLKFCRKCYPDIPVGKGGPLLQFATDALLSEVNDQVKEFHSKCFFQTLNKTVKSFKWDPRDVYRELCNIFGYTDVGQNAGDVREKLFNISCDVEAEMVDLVDVELTTNSGGARYHGQVLVRRRRNDGEILNTKIMNTYPYALTDSVQRLDIYKNTGYCVALEKQPYCICKPVVAPVIMLKPLPKI